MKFSWRLVVMALSTVVPAAGCGADPTCTAVRQRLTVRYVGQVYGYGTIGAEWNESRQKYRVSAVMVGPEGAEQIRLSGEGECNGGVLRARLGGGRDDEEGLRVLGGALVVLFEHDPIERVTGFWEVRVIREDDSADAPDGRRFRGMLEEVDASEMPDGPLQAEVQTDEAGASSREVGGASR